MDGQPREHERRRARRVPHGIVVRYRGSGAASPAWSVSLARDLSSGGARFFSEWTFRPGTALDIQLQLPNAQSAVTFRARVAWVKSAKSGQSSEVGIAFDPGDVELRQAIDEAVTAFVQERAQRSPAHAPGADPAAPSPEEHRRGPRAGQPFMVRYRSSASGAGWALSQVRDLSRGGASFPVDRALAIGTALDLELQLPSLLAPMALRGRVAWIKPGKLGTADIGVTFESVEPALQRLIDEAVTFFVRRTAPP